MTMKTRLIIMCCLALCVTGAMAQENDDTLKVVEKKVVETVKDEPVYDVVETMPVFMGAVIDVTNKKGKTKQVKIPGGDEGLRQYIYNYNVLKYPEDAEKNGKQGRVICTFIIEKDGSVTNVKSINSVYPSLDNEAVRVFQNMPKWEPGKQNGKPVRVRYTYPITFRLN